MEERIQVLEKENAELKRQLEERQMCLCIPLSNIRFKDPRFEKARETATTEIIKENLRILEWKYFQSDGFILVFW